MENEGLVRELAKIRIEAKLVFDSMELDFKWAEMNINYNDIEGAKKWLERSAMGYKGLAMEIEKLI